MPSEGRAQPALGRRSKNCEKYTNCRGPSGRVSRSLTLLAHAVARHFDLFLTDLDPYVRWVARHAVRQGHAELVLPVQPDDDRLILSENDGAGRPGRLDRGLVVGARERLARVDGGPVERRRA